jgi:hypothetical protein
LEAQGEDMFHLDFTNILTLLIAWGALGFAFVLGNFFLYREIMSTQNRENAAQTWPTVTGEIIASKVKKRHDSEHGPVEYPHVSYTYEVNGKTHHSSNIMAGGEIGGVNVESTLTRYPQGSKVTVYYDPQNPKDAVLEPGNKTISKGLWLMLALMNIFICGMGLYFTYDILT